ncbi:MAG: hypothetical protein Q3976_03730 [Corynebacterium sp.]|nr:hypothetical protein [Corynebacterium sp.]
MDNLYITLTMEIPGVGRSRHAAELLPITAEHCRILRLIEFGPNDEITGAVFQQQPVGQVSLPSEMVPHPDTYENFPEIASSALHAHEFEGLWIEAQRKFPELPGTSK